MAIQKHEEKTSNRGKVGGTPGSEIKKEKKRQTIDERMNKNSKQTSTEAKREQKRTTAKLRRATKQQGESVVQKKKTQKGKKNEAS